MSTAISRDDLRAKIQRGDSFSLFEVLPRMYWRKHHLPGAKSLPLEEIGSVATLVPDKRSEIIVYCWNFT